MTEVTPSSYPLRNTCSTKRLQQQFLTTLNLFFHLILNSQKATSLMSYPLNKVRAKLKNNLSTEFLQLPKNQPGQCCAALSQSNSLVSFILS